jgi:hypothetical protein
LFACTKETEIKIDRSPADRYNAKHQAALEPLGFKRSLFQIITRQNTIWQ